jgi:hypothetical protein
MTGMGSSTAPWRTIQHALLNGALAASDGDDEIRVAAGSTPSPERTR